MAFVPTFPAGHAVTAAEFQLITDSINGVTAFKLADQAVVSSTTLVDDTTLQLPVVANATYQLTGMVAYTSNIELKVQFVGPSGSALDWLPDGLVQGITAQTAEKVWRAMQVLGTPINMGCGGTGAKVGMLVVGRMVTAATAGTLKLQWAQATSNASNTTVKAGSWLRLQRIG